MTSKHTDDDAPLVEACLGKDPQAWARLVKKYTPLISASIAERLRKYGFNPRCEDTDEMRQNVLTSLWEKDKLQSVRNRKSIAFWLAIVSGNEAIDHMRRKIAGGHPKLIDISEIDEDIGHNDDVRPQVAELSERVEKHIDQLPLKEKLATKLNLIHGMEYKEISEILGMPIGTVSSYIRRAKERIKTGLRYP